MAAMTQKLLPCGLTDCSEASRRRTARGTGIRFGSDMNRLASGAVNALIQEGFKFSPPVRCDCEARVGEGVKVHGAVSTRNDTDLSYRANLHPVLHFFGGSLGANSEYITCQVPYREGRLADLLEVAHIGPKQFICSLSGEGRYTLEEGSLGDISRC